MRALAEAVVGFYEANRRDLPWRRTRDPYGIWVSEIMLQQTRVATVIPYWERWMARFPTVEALAAAKEEDVMAAWAGLGYYSRARNLHRGARWVVAQGGRVPSDVARLREIPGVGAYTAGAIASIAFGARAALVDGNVSRVLARVLGIEEDVKSTGGQKRVWAAAERLMAALPEAREPGALNQGLMELGATVCTPAGVPACLICPVSGQCVARRDGREGELPVMPKRKPADALHLIQAVALWIERGGRVALARRGAEGLYAGLWELPQGRDARAAAVAIGVTLTEHPVTVATHAQVLTHRRLELVLARAKVAGKAKADGAHYVEVKWSRPDEIDELGISSATSVLVKKARSGAALGKRRRPR